MDALTKQDKHKHHADDHAEQLLESLFSVRNSY